MMTFFTVFDIPVFWPILLLYFVALLFLTMKRQIRHMIKHKYVERCHECPPPACTALLLRSDSLPNSPRLSLRYVPWSWGKTKYKAGAKAAGKNSE